jgi:hypothetical protein
MNEKIADPAPLLCNCGSDDVCVAYSAPVFVYVKEDRVTRVVVDDEDAKFGGVVRCLSCDRFWLLDEEPEVSLWPAWQFGQ